MIKISNKPWSDLVKIEKDERSNKTWKNIPKIVNK